MQSSPEYLRKRLKLLSMSFEERDQTITLLENILNHNRHSVDRFSLDGLREVQRIRSKVRGHAGGSEAQEITTAAIAEHGSFKDHFTHLCGRDRDGT
jgi:hypothetical protein